MRSSKLRSTGPLIALLLLSACGKDISSCPPIATYSADFQGELAAALVALPPGSPLETALSDYAVLRQQLRACQP